MSGTTLADTLAELRELLIRRERVHARVRLALEGLAEKVQALEITPCERDGEPGEPCECRRCSLGFCYAYARTVLAEPGNVVGEQVAAALAKRPAAKLTDYRVRRCLSMHECCVCKGTIKLYQKYHDGGYGKRAHEDCARRAS